MLTLTDISKAWVKDGGLLGDLHDLTATELKDICWGCWRPGHGRKQEKAHIEARAADGDNDDPLNYFILCGRCHLKQPDGLGRADQIRWLDTVPVYYVRVIDGLRDNLGDATEQIGVSIDDMTALLDDPDKRQAFLNSVDSWRSDRETMVSNLVWQLAAAVRDGIGPPRKTIQDQAKALVELEAAKADERAAEAEAKRQAIEAMDPWEYFLQQTEPTG
tara:strand:+ start:2916 stop:3569 length:654 start_codon:yes stop_codon:yes gene_type:complete